MDKSQRDQIAAPSSPPHRTTDRAVILARDITDVQAVERDCLLLGVNARVVVLLQQAEAGLRAEFDREHTDPGA